MKGYKESSFERSEYPLMVNGGKSSELNLLAEPFNPMGETAEGDFSEPTAAPDHVSSNQEQQLREQVFQKAPNQILGL